MYLLCLDKKYNVDLGRTNDLIILNLEQMLDNMIYLLKSYGVEDAEILEEIKNDVDVDIEEEDYE